MSHQLEDLDEDNLGSSKQREIEKGALRYDDVGDDLRIHELEVQVGEGERERVGEGDREVEVVGSGDGDGNGYGIQPDQSVIVGSSDNTGIS